MPDSLTPAENIREHLARVAAVHGRSRELGLFEAVQSVKHLQACRFRGTYHDMLADPARADAARFFLEELYGDRDFTQRDRQFSRIAGAIERLFPDDIGQLACDLARLHAMTESLDLSLAGHWQCLGADVSEAQRYMTAWRLTGQPDARRQQLGAVLHLGDELQRLTRRTALRVALRMMRRPAEAAGLAALQHFLEQGFDSFARLDDPRSFINCIELRETAWLNLLDQGDEKLACLRLADTLAQGHITI